LLFVLQVNFHCNVFTGAQEYGEAAAYIQARFEAKNKSTTKSNFNEKPTSKNTWTPSSSRLQTKIKWVVIHYQPAETTGGNIAKNNHISCFSSSKNTNFQRLPPFAVKCINFSVNPWTL
jgi:hypothetical protein